MTNYSIPDWAQKIVQRTSIISELKQGTNLFYLGHYTFEIYLNIVGDSRVGVNLWKRGKHGGRKRIGFDFVQIA